MHDDTGTLRSDEELIQQLQAGDTNVLGELMNRYNPQIWGMILSQSRRYNREDAEEILQNTWIAVWKYIGSLREVSNFRAWLWKIAANECTRYYKTVYHSKRLRQRHTNGQVAAVFEVVQEMGSIYVEVVEL